MAFELTDPPFYQPQPLERVEATYQELAQESGGTWSRRAVGELHLWTLHRPSSRGHVLLLHGFGDDRWGTSPALRWFPGLDASIFTYLDRDEALRRSGGPEPFVTFGAREGREAARMVRHLENTGVPRARIVLVGRSLGATVGLLALAELEADGRGPLGGFVWEGAPVSSRDFAERLVRGPKDRFWHPLLAPLIGDLGSRWAARRGRYRREDTSPLRALEGRTLETPSLCFVATQDRLAPPEAQRALAAQFRRIRTLEVPTWHLHCAEVLGPAYAEHIQAAVSDWVK